jgi:succinate-acetate transporter protein
MGMICFIFLICATRTNIVFVVIFLSLILNFSLLVGARFALAADFSGNAAIANRCTVGAGACAFVTCMAGWYLLTAIMLAIVDYPIQIPVGDLSTVIKGRSVRMAKA